MLADNSADAGAAIAEEAVSRGAATGDIDNDGDIDIVVSNNSGSAQLLLNQTRTSSSWVGVGLNSNGGNILGARVALQRDGDDYRWQRVYTDGSYASASDPRIVFLADGDATRAEIVVRLPDGRLKRWPALGTGQYHEIAVGFEDDAQSIQAQPEP